MTVTVEIFGELKRVFGWNSRIVGIEDGWTINDLLEHMGGKAVSGRKAGMIINRNGRRSSLDAGLANGDVIQLIKPMVGG